MTDLEVAARGLLGGECKFEQLRCHRRLPLVVCSDSERPAVHIWDCGAGQLRELGSVGLTSNAYGDAFGWERAERTPAVAWHPHQPLLVVTGEDGLRQWTPAGVCEPEDAPATASYRSLAFSPDGQALWSSLSLRDEGGGWESSDVLDLASGTIGAGAYVLLPGQFRWRDQESLCGLVPPQTRRMRRPVRTTHPGHHLLIRHAEGCHCRPPGPSPSSPRPPAALRGRASAPRCSRFPNPHPGGVGDR